MQRGPVLWGFTFLSCFLLVATRVTGQDTTTTVNAEVWADNWFALYVDGELIAEDSVSIETEMSFNAESFSFSTTLPAQIGVIAKDFKENDSGLEYIGSRRQQMGDGGFIAQFIDADSDRLLAVTDDSWVCMVIHQGPLNRECERSMNPDQECRFRIQDVPENWASADFDDSGWPGAVEHSIQAVRPHGGYNRVSWQPSAKLIWTEDLVVDNTLLCRFILTGG